MAEFREKLQILNLHAGEVTSCDFNSNYLLAIGCSDKKVSVMEWKPGLGYVDMHYSPLLSHKYGVTSVKFSARGVMLASSSLDGTAVLHDVLTGNTIFVMVQTNASSVRYCQFTSDSTKIITGGDDGIFCFWDLITHTQIRNCQFYDDGEVSVRNMALSPDSQLLLLVDSKGSLKLWNIDAIMDEEPKCIFFKENIHDDIFSCDFSPTMDTLGISMIKYIIATSGADGIINVMSITAERRNKCPKYSNCSLTEMYTLKGHKNEVFNVKFNATGEILSSTGLDNTVKLWQALTGQCLQTLKGHTRFGTCSAFSKDSVLLATGSNDKTVIVWNLKPDLNLDTQLVQSCNVASHFTSVDLVNYFKKQRKSSKDTFNDKNFIISQKITFSSAIHSVHMYGNHILAVAGGEKTVGIWKKEKSEFMHEPTDILQNHKYGVNYSEISPCGTKVISCSRDGVIVFWNLNMGLIHDMKIPDCANGLRVCRFSPNSEFIAAAGDDQKVFLWSAHNLEFIRVVQEHDDSVTSLVFTPDSKYLVSACAGGDIKLYSFKDDKCSAIVKEAHDLGAMGCDISTGTVNKFENTEIYSTADKTPYKDNYLLASCGNDSFVKLWQIKDSYLQLINILSGHGGTVNCVRFAISDPFMLASCSADRTVRIWAVKLGVCTQVLNLHENYVTTCSFSEDSTILVTGSLDKTVGIWILSEKLSPNLIDLIQNSSKEPHTWNALDIKTMLVHNGFPEIAEKISNRFLNDEKLFNLTDDLIIKMMGILNKRDQNILKMHLYCLRNKNTNTFLAKCYNKRIPHKLLCPLSHDIMENPVVCSDGYTYDRKAIIEWFLSRKVTSPITKEHLTTLKFLPNTIIKRNICEYLSEFWEG